MSEKFISYDNLRQYDEFLDQELQDIKQHIDEGFTYNVKYAESNEIGGAALKAISDENNENIAEHFSNNESDIIINKTTLGYQKKNLFNWENATWLNPSGSITVTKTNTNISVTSKNSWASATYKFPTLEVGRKYTFSVLISDLIKDSAAEVNRVKIRLSYDSGGQRPIQDFNLESDGNYKMTFTPTSDTVYVIFYPNYSGSVLTNSFTASEIMLRYANITDDTYEPYIGSVDERLNKFTNDIVSLGAIVANDRSIDKTTLGYTKKNLLKNNAKSTTIQGVTITVNDDKSITVSGTNTGGTIWHNVYGTQDIPMTELEIGQSYILSGTPTDNLDNNEKRAAYLRIEKRSMVITSDSKGEGAKFTVTSNVRPEYVILYIGSGADYTDKPLIFYPMIRHAEVMDSMYEPYVDDVNTRIIENKSDIAINKTTLGYTKKNLFNLTKAAGSTTISGITFTVNDDKTITLNGTATATPYFELKGNLNIRDKNLGGCKYSTGLTQNVNSGCYVNISYYDANWSHQENQIVSNKDVVLNGNYTYATHSIVVTKGTTLNNVIVKPMVRLPDITDDTYEPYVESVDERLQNFVKSGSGAKSGLVPAPSTTAGTTKYLREDGTWQVPPDSNTHYASKNIVGGATATSNTTTALTNGNVYLNSVENGAVTSAHKISGSGTTTVTTDTSGNIIIKSTDTNTDTKVTQTVKTDNANYPLLCTPSGQTATTTTTTCFAKDITLQPSTGILTATSFKSSGNNLLASGSITFGNDITTSINVTVENLNRYSTLYLNIRRAAQDFVISGIIPVSYLLADTTNKIEILGSIKGYPYGVLIKASGNTLIIQSPNDQMSQQSVAETSTYYIYKI